MPTLVELAAAAGDVDTSDTISVATMFGKAFIANGANKYVMDFINTKITTAAVGSHPPDFGTALTGGTSGAIMYVDYISSLTGACTIYGKKTTADYSFASGETVTGTDDDGNAISFVLSANETAPVVAGVRTPHWYAWTTFGNSDTFGELPSKIYLAAVYQVRLVIAGSPDYPNQWWVSRSTNPWRWDLQVNDELSANFGAAGNLGQASDLIRGLIPYKDDILILACASSLKAIVGNPSAGGEMIDLSNYGIWGKDAHCFDGQGFLYFMSPTAGLMKCSLTANETTEVSTLPLPEMLDAYNPAEHRICLAYNAKLGGIVITITAVLTGVCTGYFYSLKTEGFYPITLPDECGVYAALDFPANDPDDRGLIFGCRDGFIRKLDFTAKDDNVGSTSEAIDAHVVFPIAQLGNEETEGRLHAVTVESGGGAASGTYADTDTLMISAYPGETAETVAEDIRDGATAAATATLTGPGRQLRARLRTRGHYVALKASDATASSSFSVNRIVAEVQAAAQEEGA